jgi:hypothetical protein
MLHDAQVTVALAAVGLAPQPCQPCRGGSARVQGRRANVTVAAAEAVVMGSVVKSAAAVECSTVFTAMQTGSRDELLSSLCIWIQPRMWLLCEGFVPTHVDRMQRLPAYELWTCLETWVVSRKARHPASPPGSTCAGPRSRGALAPAARLPTVPVSTDLNRTLGGSRGGDAMLRAGRLANAPLAHCSIPCRPTQRMQPCTARSPAAQQKHSTAAVPRPSAAIPAQHMQAVRQVSPCAAA